MVCISGPSFLQRKARAATPASGRFEIRHPHLPVDIEEQALQTQARLYSMASSNSRSSSESDHSSRAPSFNPLQSHPPLQINASPITETKFMDINETRTQQSSRQEIDEFAIHEDETSSESRPTSSRRITYIYDQGAQWPLKDWQTIPPGFAGVQEPSDFTTALRPTPANHMRRPTECRNESERFVKRGSWKRRGIIFHSDSSSDDESVEHFELPEE